MCGPMATEKCNNQEHLHTRQSDARQRKLVRVRLLYQTLMPGMRKVIPVLQSRYHRDRIPAWLLPRQQYRAPGLSETPRPGG
jgi:hypothetical protein